MNMFDYKEFKKEMAKRGHEVHKKGDYVIIVPNNNVNGYGKGFLSALEIVSGYEDRLIFVSMDHFNSYVYSARFMLA